MTININYGNKVAVLPASVIDHIDKASSRDVKVLISVLSRAGGETDLQPIAGELGLDLSELIASLDFWQKTGVIAISEELKATDSIKNAKEPQAKPKKTKALRKTDEIPRYTTEELSEILASREETSHLIHECQQRFGKMFNTHEINILLGLVDYLALGWDYVLELLEFCARNGKHSMNYVERTAFGLFESGIDTVAALKIYIEETETLKSKEGFVRKLFGMKSRALTAKEKKCIAAWFGKYGYGEDVINKAYELTVSATNEPSVPYANAIIERWFSEGMKTVEDIDNAMAQREQNAEKKSEDGSFDTDDFFEAALKRSYDKK